MLRITTLIACMTLAASCAAPGPARPPIAHGVLGAVAVEELGRREIRIDGSLQGYWEEMRFRDLDGRIHLYREVSDAWDQALGYIDENWRVFRFDPFGGVVQLTTAPACEAVLALFGRERGAVEFVPATLRSGR